MLVEPFVLELVIILHWNMHGIILIYSTNGLECILQSQENEKEHRQWYDYRAVTGKYANYRVAVFFIQPVKQIQISLTYYYLELW